MGVWDDFFDRAKSFFSPETNAESQSRCYYELLKVPRDATEEQIKKSYRKLALQYHPDKVEEERREECTAYFVLLQQAYEVLSDPQERAFYDKHRENIIYGSAPEEKRDTGISLYPFFQKCYISFEDDENGFYYVYRQLFDKLAAEEYPYIEDEDERDFPSFGYSKSEYDQVVGPFYDHWSSFCTQRSFAWLDKYDLRQAPDRYNLKLMEKENKKLRDQGKKQRNEEIRNLVAYVRKRDKRVQLYRAQLEQRKQDEMDRVEKERKQKIRENLRRFEEEQVVVDTPEYHLEELEKIENELDEKFGVLACDDEDGSDFYCVACEKKFKTAKSFHNHEKSKKHKQALLDLKKYMTEDDQLLFGDDNEEEEEVEETTKRKKKNKRKNKNALKEDEKEAEDFPQADEDAKPSEDASTAKSTETADPSDNPTKSKHNAERKAKTKKSEHAPSKNPGGQTVPVASSCKVCGEQFDSKTKLFAHIKEEGHAALKEEISNQKNRKKKK